MARSYWFIQRLSTLAYHLMSTAERTCRCCWLSDYSHAVVTLHNCLNFKSASNVSVKSKLKHPPPGIPWAFDVFCCLGGRELNEWMNEWMNEGVFIYRTYHIVSQGGLQIYLSEIGRQLVKAPLAAALSPYLISPTHPTHAWNVQWNNDTTDRPQHRELSPLLFSTSV